jgi:hypothetical protein
VNPPKKLFHLNIWVNDHISLSSNARPFGDNYDHSPNPKHEIPGFGHSEVTIIDPINIYHNPQKIMISNYFTLSDPHPGPDFARG